MVIKAPTSKRQRVELWTRILHSKNKVATSLTIIKRLSIKLGDSSSPNITKIQTVKKLKEAKKARNKVEKK